MTATKRMRTEKICVLGMLTALFVVLSMCLRVPVFDNFYLCLGYIAMFVALAMYGILGGTIVGVCGTAIYCLLISGLRGMPGWICGNICIGVILGLWLQMTSEISNKFLWYPSTILVIVIANVVGILFTKSVVEMLLYAQPLMARVATNLPAFIADIAVLAAAIPVWKLLEPHIKKFTKTAEA